MKYLLIVLFSMPLFVLAQNIPLAIEGTAPGFYVSHKVAPKENYYSIGRIYNISPKEVAPFNNLVLENGLSLGQDIKIPLSAANFLQSGNAAADEALIPVYHSVEGKESLYRISLNYNKIPVETLKLWNNLKGDAVSNGVKLVVGYLKVKKDLSPLASMAQDKPADNNVAVKETGKADVAVGKLSPANENPPLPEQTKKEPVADATANETLTGSKRQSPASGNNFNGGVFKSDYEKQTQDKDISGETGEAAVFKSTSGWADGKYYCLHNSSSPGTIVKITNTSSGKSVYAKVLDVIPDIIQDTGLLIRVSNAAAEELGAAGSKFGCTLSYSK